MYVSVCICMFHDHISLLTKQNKIALKVGLGHWVNVTLLKREREVCTGH